MSARRAVAVSGASGLVGGLVCAHLAARGFDVRALVRDSTRCPAGTRGFRCDLPDELDLAGLEGAELLVHCAWATRARSREEARRTNEDGTRRLYEAARSASAVRIVFVSSIAARADSPAYYARSKAALEGELDPARDVCLRPGLVLARAEGGLFARMRASVARSPLLPVFGGGRQVVQTLHEADLLAALDAALALRRGGTYAVAEPEGIRYRELLLGIARRLGLRRALVSVPFAPALLALRAAEAFRLPLPVSSENLLGLREMRAVDTRADLARLGIVARAAERSLDELCGAA